MVEIKFLVRVPMDTWRQWIRHRTASVNEYSTRYSIAIDAAYETEPIGWRKQAESNRQGSDGFIDENVGFELCEAERVFHKQARELYESRIAQGIAREQARKDLPLATYTEAYWKTNLHNLFRFLYLRMASDAQFEIRSYAETIGHAIVKPLFPMAWEAFIDYQFESLRLSKLDREMITRITATGKVPIDESEFLMLQDEAWRNLERCRERDECLVKLRELGLVK
jgi:thymidylate synthase (FAD)